MENNSLKVGERLQIVKDQRGKPVFEYNRKKKEYKEECLQWFEVTEVLEDGKGYKLKPVWNE